jgi:hypothetical protein
MTTADSILSKYSPSVSSLGFQLRKFVFDNLKDIIEYPDGSANMIAYGYGSGYKETICTIIPSQKGMKLGFYKGSELSDPDKLLTGMGKVHRHVVISNDDDLKNPALKKLLGEALIAYKKRNTGS